MNLFLNETSIDLEKYFVVTYLVESDKNLRDAAWNIA